MQLLPSSAAVELLPGALVYLMTSWPAAALELDHWRSGSGRLLLIHRPRVPLKYFCLSDLITYCESLGKNSDRFESVAINNHLDSRFSA